MPQLDVTLHGVAAVPPADYTRPGLIVQQLHERDAAGIIGKLSQVLHRKDCVPAVLPFYHSVRIRQG